MEPGEDAVYRKMYQAGRQGFIYMLRMLGNQEGFDPAPRYFKIGLTTRTVDERIREHKNGNPFKLDVVGSWRVNDVDNAENAVKNALIRSHRQLPFEGGTEWFKILPSSEGRSMKTFYATVQAAVEQYLQVDNQVGTRFRVSDGIWDYYNPATSNLRLS